MQHTVALFQWSVRLALLLTSAHASRALAPRDSIYDNSFNDNSFNENMNAPDEVIEIDFDDPGAYDALFPSGAAKQQPRLGGPSIPASAIRDIFPQPILYTDQFSGHSRTMDDAVMQDMMQDVDPGFSRDVLPIARRAASVSGTLDECQDDAKHLCAYEASALHCLGTHASEISDGCRKGVSKSVPFVCASAIDKWCNVGSKGILGCLVKRVPQLNGACRDAVVAARQLITQLNTKKVAVTDPKTGARTVSTPTISSVAVAEESVIDKSMTKEVPVAATDPKTDVQMPTTPTISSAAVLEESVLDKEMGQSPPGDKLSAPVASQATASKTNVPAQASTTLTSQTKVTKMAATIKSPAPISTSWYNFLGRMFWPDTSAGQIKADAKNIGKDFMAGLVLLFCFLSGITAFICMCAFTHPYVVIGAGGIFCIKSEYIAKLLDRQNLKSERVPLLKSPVRFQCPRVAG